MVVEILELLRESLEGILPMGVTCPAGVLSTTRHGVKYIEMYLNTNTNTFEGFKYKYKYF